MNVTGHGEWNEKDANSAQLKLRLQPHDDSELERLKRLARGEFKVRAYLHEGCLHLDVSATTPQREAPREAKKAEA